jgi:uncharacterized protein YdcH (DUF465 family)
MSKESLHSHLQSLTVKHRNLDNEILELEKSYAVNEEIRRLKTQKLWLKDEIYRIKRELKELGVYTNGQGT